MNKGFDLKNVKAIIGLGNPGFRYYKNRHNIGFRIVDVIADQFTGSWQSKDDLEYCDIQIGSGEPVDPSGEVQSSCGTKTDIPNMQRIILVKPQTFMNASGKVLSFLLKKGIDSEEILVIHDELEKPFGKINLKFDGSAKGHNGLRSIMGVIGSDFWRLQFGIGRPENKDDVGNYVLTNFSQEQESQIDSLIEDAINRII